MRDYNFSVAIHRLYKKYGMARPEYLLYADLRAIGWSVYDAWSVAFQGLGLNWPKDELQKEQEKLESLESVQKRISDINGKLTEGRQELSLEELAHETSKEKILADLILARRKLREGSKEWGDYTKMIAEYSKIKQDDIQVEDTTVHFYIPERYPRK